MLGLPELVLAVPHGRYVASEGMSARGAIVDVRRDQIAELVRRPFWFALGAHEWGHWWAAQRRGVELYLPVVVPAGFGFLGSFGAITRVRGFIPNRWGRSGGGSRVGGMRQDFPGMLNDAQIN